ncbi:MAG: BrnT family toxin [Alphaproteobacteria bacterium]|nr:BrnT family toxin [Alphaproteobacteria bacterium]
MRCGEGQVQQAKARHRSCGWRALFANPYLEERGDRFSYGEERYIATGIVGPIVLVCAYTLRGKTARVISIRRATRGEASAYYQAYGS